MRRRQLVSEVATMRAELNALHTAATVALDAAANVSTRLAEFLTEAQANPRWRDPILEAVDEQLKAVVALAEVGT